MSAFKNLSQILILGGTGDAPKIAESLESDPSINVAITLSLAGRTTNPQAIKGHVISGGFGGIEGLANYLERQNINMVIDATHPYAAQISRHAFEVCTALNIPLCRFERPQWEADQKDIWHEVENIDAAIKLAPTIGQRIFLTTGSNDLERFFILSNVKIWARVVELNANIKLPSNVTPILARGPFDFTSEKELICNHQIDLIISKNSGGDATKAKLLAARELRIPVIMIARPKLPDTNIFDTIEAMCEWVKNCLL